MNMIDYKGHTIKIERVMAQLRCSQQAHWYAQIDGKEVSKSSFRSRKSALARAKEKIDEQNPAPLSPQEKRQAAMLANADLRELVKRLTKTLEDIVENDGHYPENAPIRKLLTEAREATKQ